MKKTILAGILLLSTLFTFGHGFSPDNCSNGTQFTFHLYNGPAGLAQVIQVDTITNAPIAGGDTLNIVVPASGNLDIVVSKLLTINKRVKLTWSDGFVSFAQTNNNICSGLPLKMINFQLNKYTNTLSFDILDEIDVLKYKIKKSTDYINWYTIDTILPKNGSYSLKLK